MALPGVMSATRELDSYWRSQRPWSAETWSKLVALTHGRLECGTTAGTSGNTERAVRPARAAPGGASVF